MIRVFFMVAFSFGINASLHGQAPSFEWVRTYGDDHSSISKIVIDENGDIYSAGLFTGDCNFSLGFGTNILSTSNTDLFITKTSSDGTLIWARQIEGDLETIATGMAIDSLSNIYITGYFYGTTDFDPSASVYNLLSNGDEDNYILKLDSAGNFVWAHGFGSTLNEWGWGCTIDSNGYLYLCGFVGGPSNIDYDFGPNTYMMVGAGNFLLKTDLDGNLIWGQKYSQYVGIGIPEINSNNELVICGTFSGGTADFDASPAVYNANMTGAVQDIFVLTLNENGGFMSVGVMGGMYLDKGDIVLDELNNIYMLASFSNSTDFDWGAGTNSISPLGAFDVAIVKYSAVGDLIWVKPLVGTLSDDIEDIARDSDNNLYITGSFNGTTDFDPSSASFNVTGDEARYLAKYDSSGQFIWVRQLGDEYFDQIHQIELDVNDFLYVCGQSKLLTDFDLGVSNYMLNSSAANAFLVKYSDCIVTNSFIDTTVCSELFINGETFYNTGTFIQTVQSASGCDSIIQLNLTVDPSSGVFDNTITSSMTYITASLSGAIYQWLDCSNSFVELSGMVSQDFYATTVGDFAVEINLNGCLDTSNCIQIISNDFYNTVGYSPLNLEVFPLPISAMGLCDGQAFSTVSGGVAPLVMVWSDDAFPENPYSSDSICYGFYNLKVYDNIGDSVVTPFFVTDSVNYYNWYSFTGIVDTLYLNAENCLLNYNIAIDSAHIAQFNFIGPDISGTGDLYLAEFVYYQAGVAYNYQDTLLITISGNQLVMFAVWCPSKSASTIKIMNIDFLFPDILSVNENEVSGLTFFPNPTHDQVFIKNDAYAINQVEIIDLTGRKVFEYKVKGESLIELSLNDFLPGVYMLKILQDAGWVSRKLILE